MRNYRHAGDTRLIVDAVSVLKSAYLGRRCTCELEDIWNSHREGVRDSAPGARTIRKICGTLRSSLRQLSSFSVYLAPFLPYTTTQQMTQIFSGLRGGHDYIATKDASIPLQAPPISIELTNTWCDYYPAPADHGPTRAGVGAANLHHHQALGVATICQNKDAGRYYSTEWIPVSRHPIEVMEVLQGGTYSLVTQSYSLCAPTG